MKASTAATILRSMRARAEQSGLIQIGEYEIVSLAVAKQVLNQAHHFKTGMIPQMNVLFVAADEKLFEYLRNGYKTLDKIDPNEEYKFGEFPQIMDELFNEKEAEEKESGPPIDNDVINKLLASVPDKASDIPPDEPKKESEPPTQPV